jgi:hypothetical protein
MIFFFERNQETLRLETRYDNDGAAFIGTVTYPNGTQQTERFPMIEGFQAWLVAFERRLNEEGWIARGDPTILPYGWPHRRLR